MHRLCKYYAILYKWLEHLWILVSLRCPGTNLPWIQRDGCIMCIYFFYFKKFYSTDFKIRDFLIAEKEIQSPNDWLAECSGVLSKQKSCWCTIINCLLVKSIHFRAQNHFTNYSRDTLQEFTQTREFWVMHLLNATLKNLITLCILFLEKMTLCVS